MFAWQPVEKRLPGDGFPDAGGFGRDGDLRLGEAVGERGPGVGRAGREERAPEEQFPGNGPGAHGPCARGGGALTAGASAWDSLRWNMR